MDQLIKFTDAAVAHIKQMMIKQTNSIGFRLAIKKTGCSGYAYVPAIIEKITDGDMHFVTQDQLPVYIDSSSVNLLKDVRVDYIAESKEGLKQKRLVFINPNEKNRCGCGESFTIE
jgi:iron-sulfur cluster assembly protein